MSLLIALFVVGLALTIVGIAVQGLFWLAIIGLVLFLASVIVAGIRGPVS